MEDSETDAQHGPASTDLPDRQVTINQVVAWNLAYFRDVAGLTGEQLGQRLGWSKAIVSAAERSWDGKRIRQFTADDMVAISLVLDVPIAAFLLPPTDAGTSVHYVVNTGSATVDLSSLLPPLESAYVSDSATVRAYRQRLTALGLGGRSPAAIQADAIINHAIAEADDILAGARKQSEELTGEAKERADAIERIVEDRYRKAMGSLVQAREELERRVSDLHAFEGEYRRRLMAYFESQLADLRAGAADSQLIAPVNTPPGKELPGSGKVGDS